MKSELRWKRNITVDMKREFFKLVEAAKHVSMKMYEDKTQYMAMTK